MKKYTLYICIATLLASCNRTDLGPNTTERDTMSFVAQLSTKEDDRGTSTRGATTTSSTITDFASFCFRTERELWDDVKATALPDKMFDTKVTRSGTDWSYTPGVMWGGDYSFYTFFGYSPYSTGVYDPTDNPTGNNIELTSTAATPGVPVIRFAPLADLSSQVDLLVAKPIYNTVFTKYVAMNFAHALTQVRFKGWTEQPKTVITSIKIHGVVGKASLEIGGTDNKWTADPSAKSVNYLYAFSPLEVSTDKASMTDFSPGNNVFMLLPQDMTANETADEKAVVQFAYTIDEVPLIKEYVLKEDWKRNRAMTYTVNLTEADEPLEMTVAVTDWVIGTGGVGDADVEVVLEEGSYIPNSVLRTARWPENLLPIEGGLQVAMRGNVLPGGTPAAEDPKIVWSTESVVTGITEAGLGKGKGNYALLAVKDAVKYPIGQACKHLGPGWYVPSLNELTLIYANTGLLLESYKFNDAKKYYWGSTEFNDARCNLVDFSSGSLVQAPKGPTNYPVRCVKGTPPSAQVAVTTDVQADIPIVGGTYTVQLTSNYAWTANSTVSGVAVTPASGTAGTTAVQITIPANATTSAVSYPVVFTATDGVAIAATTWTGTQLALPLPFISMTPTDQVDIPIAGGTYTVELTSNYAWGTNALPSGVTVTPSSGTAGTTAVQIAVPANATTSAVSHSVEFTTTGGGTTATSMWIGTQLAPPPLFVEVNGLKWANGNLVADGANGAKIGAPTDYGLYFKFGSLIGWSGGATGDGTGAGSPALAISVKPATYVGFTDWTTCGYYSLGDKGSALPTVDVAATGIGDPCRHYLGAPWRTPTKAEIQSLCNGYVIGSDFTRANAEWQDSPAGMNFNILSTKFFIPASGSRNESDGRFDYAEVRGHFWSGLVFSDNATRGYLMEFYKTFMMSEQYYDRTFGFPARCVQ